MGAPQQEQLSKPLGKELVDHNFGVGLNWAEVGPFSAVVHQVIYSSAAVEPFSDSALTELLTAARVNNGRLELPACCSIMRARSFKLWRVTKTF